MSYALEQDATVSREILAALQRVVLNPLAAETRLAGDHELSLSVGTLPSGTYSVRVKALLANGTLLLEQRPLIIVR